MRFKLEFHYAQEIERNGQEALEFQNNSNTKGLKGQVITDYNSPEPKLYNKSVTCDGKIKKTNPN